MPEKKKVTTKKATVKASAKKPVKVEKPLKAQSQKVAANGSLQVYDLQGKTLETLTLDSIFTDQEVNTDVIYQAIVKYQAGEREGTAATKDRGHVRGGGKKPWKQKGTGQARHGSRRSPIWRGGGVTFGPQPRSYDINLSSQLKRKAVVELVKDKVLNGKLFCVNQMNIEEPKTKKITKIMDTFKLEKPLILVDQKSKNLLLASRNLATVAVKTSNEVNALDLATHKECLITKAAYSGLVERLKS